MASFGVLGRTIGLSCRIDASEALLAIARERTPSGDFRVSEIEELPFADSSFDVVTGFNSFQYAANVGAALQQACRVVRSKGAVLMLAWGPPDGMPAASVVAALRPLTPPPAPGAPGPFALSGESALRRIRHRFALLGRIDRSGVTGGTHDRLS